MINISAEPSKTKIYKYSFKNLYQLAKKQTLRMWTNLTGIKP